MLRVHALFAEPFAAPRALRATDAKRCAVFHRTADQLSGLEVPAIGASIEGWFEHEHPARAWMAHLAKQTAAQSILLTDEYTLFEKAGFEKAGFEKAGFEKMGAEAAIKGKFLFRRKAGMTVTAFQAYWRLRHGPIVLRTPEILRYVQSHMPPSAYADGEPVYDGITEIHWPDHAATVRSMGSPEMTVEQSTDARNFAEPGSVTLVLMREVDFC